MASFMEAFTREQICYKCGRSQLSMGINKSWDNPHLGRICVRESILPEKNTYKSSDGGKLKEKFFEVLH